jgi:hypothetical protein
MTQVDQTMRTAGGTHGSKAGVVSSNGKDKSRGKHNVPSQASTAGDNTPRSTYTTETREPRFGSQSSKIRAGSGSRSGKVSTTAEGDHDHIDKVNTDISNMEQQLDKIFTMTLELARMEQELIDIGTSSGCVTNSKKYNSSTLAHELSEKITQKLNVSKSLNSLLEQERTLEKKLEGIYAARTKALEEMKKLEASKAERDRLKKGGSSSGATSRGKGRVEHVDDRHDFVYEKELNAWSRTDGLQDKEAQRLELKLKQTREEMDKYCKRLKVKIRASK